MNTFRPKTWTNLGVSLLAGGALAGMATPSLAAGERGERGGSYHGERGEHAGERGQRRCAVHRHRDGRRYTDCHRRADDHGERGERGEHGRGWDDHGEGGERGRRN